MILYCSRKLFALFTAIFVSTINNCRISLVGDLWIFGKFSLMIPDDISFSDKHFFLKTFRIIKHLSGTSIAILRESRYVKSLFTFLYHI